MEHIVLPPDVCGAFEWPKSQRILSKGEECTLCECSKCRILGHNY